MSSRSVADIAAAVYARTASAEEVARETLSRAEEYDRVQPQTWISRCSREDVLASAQRVDARVADGELLPLAGVPFAVKDNIDVAGMETTVACPSIAYVAKASAVVVERLRKAGAVLIGKTNLDQFATGLTGTRSPYGVPGCVYNREYVSGGSSSGSAVVVGAGIVPLALGSDTAGSGRIPAAFNHVVGFKPTRGRWSTRGLFPACRSLDCVSAFTTTAEDARRVDEIATGFDAEDPFSRRPLPGPQLAREVRIGVPQAGQLELGGDAGAAALYHDALERLARIGGREVAVDITPLLQAAELLYGGPWVAERTAVLEELLRQQPTAIHPVVRAIVQAGGGISAAQAFRAFHALKGHARAAERLWEAIDVLLLPTAPAHFRIAEVLAEPVQLNSHLGRYTNFANLLDMSAVAYPAGFHDNSTPFGVMLLGPAWADRALLALVAKLEALQPLPPPPPLDFATTGAGIALAVVGAHLSGMPLHWQLASRNARLIARTRTAPTYRLYAMCGTTPPKPALVHAQEGRSIEVEVYELDVAAFGSFVSEVPAPLAIGTVLLEDGRAVRGFVAEPRAMEGAEDITAAGGWRAYLARAQR
jgi:allophanate hydrolase